MSPIGEKIRCYCTRFREELFFSISRDEERESIPVVLEAVEVFSDIDECFSSCMRNDAFAFGAWSITKKSFLFKSIEYGVVPDSQEDVLYVKFKMTLGGSFAGKTASMVAREYGQTLEYFEYGKDSVEKARGAARFENFLVILAKKNEILPREDYRQQAIQIMDGLDPLGDNDLSYERMVARTWILEMEDKELYSTYNDYIRQGAPEKPAEDPSSTVEQQTVESIPSSLIIEVPFGLADCGHEPTEEEIRSRIVNMYESKARSVVYEKYGVFPSRCHLARHEALFTYAYDIYWSRSTTMVEVEVFM